MMRFALRSRFVATGCDFPDRLTYRAPWDRCPDRYEQIIVWRKHE
jgi:hypothetical protein